MATIEELLRRSTERLRASGSESARLDAELLLGYALGAERTQLLANPLQSVSDEAAARFEADLVRREAGEPIAYIRGFKEFYGLALSVDARALIPRPATERLVELAQDEIIRRLTTVARPPGTPSLRVVDVGTGSGTIAIALAVALRRRGIADEVDLFGLDDSPDALELARENAVGHSVADKVLFLEADLFPPVIVTPWDLVLANLPYIPSGAVDHLPIAASFEPRHALDGGQDGLAVIDRLVERLPEALASGGVAMLEIGDDQESAVVGLARRQLAGWPVRVERDLGGSPRVAVIERPRDDG